jgi:hypothetical protein
MKKNGAASFTALKEEYHFTVFLVQFSVDKTQ